MQTFLKFSVYLFLITLTVQLSEAQDLNKPDPVKSAFVGKIMGVWVSEPYEMIGATWTEEANHYMMHNGQFMFIEIKGKNNMGDNYNGTIIIQPSKDGSFAGWSFDDWGIVSNITGKTLNDNKATFTSSSSWGTELREITIDGDKMTHKLTFIMKGQDGNEQTMNLVIHYNNK